VLGVPGPPRPSVLAPPPQLVPGALAPPWLSANELASVFTWGGLMVRACSHAGAPRPEGKGQKRALLPASSPTGMVLHGAGGWRQVAMVQRIRGAQWGCSRFG